MTDTNEAHVPAEPLGVRLLVDRDGDVWQRNHDGVYGNWTCIRPKVQGLLGAVRMTTWQNLVVSFGPLSRLERAGSAGPGD